MTIPSFIHISFFTRVSYNTGQTICNGHSYDVLCVVKDYSTCLCLLSGNPF